MGRYVSGPSVIQLPGRAAVVPGDVFDYDGYTPEQEAALIAAGAIQTYAEPPRPADESSTTDSLEAPGTVEEAALGHDEPPVRQPRRRVLGDKHDHVNG